MKSTRWLPAALVLFLPGFSVAAVPLQPHAAATHTVGMPQSWTVVEDAPNGLLLARQNAAREDSATAIFLFKPGVTNRTEDQLIDTLSSQFAKNLVVRMREAIPGGGRQMVADGVWGAARVRVGMIAVVANNTAVVSLVVAETANFEALGGMDLVAGIMATLKVRGSAAAPPPAQAAPPATGGRLEVPPPARPLTSADLAGEWTNGDSVMTRYVNFRGDSAGFESIATREKWIFDGKGGVSSGFSGITSGRGGTRQINEQKSGSVTFSQGTVMTMVWRGASTSIYVIRGWGEIPGATVLLLNGPWYDGGVPADVLADRNKGVNLNSYWLRKKP